MLLSLLKIWEFGFITAKYWAFESLPCYYIFYFIIYPNKEKRICTISKLTFFSLIKQRPKIQNVFGQAFCKVCRSFLCCWIYLLHIYYLISGLMFGATTFFCHFYLYSLECLSHVNCIRRAVKCWLLTGLLSFAGLFYFIVSIELLALNSFILYYELIYWFYLN